METTFTRKRSDELVFESKQVGLLHPKLWGARGSIYGASNEVHVEKERCQWQCTKREEHPHREQLQSAALQTQAQETVHDHEKYEATNDSTREQPPNRAERWRQISLEGAQCPWQEDERKHDLAPGLKIQGSDRHFLPWPEPEHHNARELSILPNPEPRSLSTGPGKFEPDHLLRWLPMEGRPIACSVSSLQHWPNKWKPAGWRRQILGARLVWRHRLQNPAIPQQATKFRTRSKRLSAASLPPPKAQPATRAQKQQSDRTIRRADHLLKRGPAQPERATTAVPEGPRQVVELAISA